ncbi:DUF4129 domain-containing protein [Streptomyces sp. 21So2-11]|uniref:DUF4129 domain-containing protein n=1 Tax=Streptomyces sp. 21So2-11 TaxID=3144408 RepID=UPI00321A2EF7
MFTAGGTTAADLWARTAEDVPVDVPRVPAREAAEQELSNPMYRENEPSAFQRALDSFWSWIDDLFGAASGAAPGGMVGILGVALLVVLLVLGLWWRLGTPQRTPAAEGTLFDDGPRSAAEHRAAAETHAAAQRWTEAVQERMRAVVRSLEERALLDPRPGRTANEAAAEAGRPLPDHADRLRAAAREFDDVAYGGRTTDKRAYRRLSELDSDLERAKPLLSGAATGVAE